MPPSSLNPIWQSIPSELRSEAQESVPVILQTALQQGITDRAQLAYILATAEHESKLGRFMEEIWDPQSVPAQRDYDAPGDPKGLGNRPNPSPNADYTNGDGYRYRGRGFVQVTGRDNYQEWSKKLGVDLVKDPARASEAAIAAQVIVRGMQEGTFTSRKLSDYLQAGNADFHNARRIVNGLDKADEIAKIANAYLGALEKVDIRQLQKELQAEPSLAGRLGATAATRATLPQLQLGDRQPAVQQLQTSLNQLGYSVPVNSTFGPETAAAVKDLQKSQKLSADGIVGPQTWQAINRLQQQAQQSGQALGKATAAREPERQNHASIGTQLAGVAQSGKPKEKAPAKPMVRQGDRGKTVTEIQITLNKLGYGLTVDGIFGPHTDRAVRNFQSSRRLAKDGVVGPQTWQALQQVQQSAIATELGNSAHQTASGKGIKLDPLTRPPGETYYGAARANGRKHAGVDVYNPKATTENQAPQATLGGIIVKVAVQTDEQGRPTGYGHYIDVYNPQLGVVERTAEYDRPRFTKADEGKVIPAGTVVGTGANQNTIIHREIRPYETYSQGEQAQYGFAGTVDWAKYMTDLGLYRQEGENLLPTGRTIVQQYGATAESSGLGATVGQLTALAERSQAAPHLQAAVAATATLQNQLALAPEHANSSAPASLPPIRSLADAARQLAAAVTPAPTPEPHQPASGLELE